MTLKIGDAAINDPVRDDIVRAIDLGPHGTGWRLALDNGQDDHIEAIAAGDGSFRMTFVDRGLRLEAEAPIDAETLSCKAHRAALSTTSSRRITMLIDCREGLSRRLPAFEP